MFIEILPEHVRKLISAGEVIESPADCVKELIENSLDAKATKIEVEVVKGGKSYISVKDDGIGIHPHDIDKVILEYATSKIRSIEDLSYLQTYGFRGEALTAIARVSRMVISSRFFQEKEGVQMKVEGGKVIYKRETGMSTGTKIEVFDLFYNLPARQKFLKKEDTERNKVLKLIKRYAIAKHNVHFVFVSNNRQVLNLPKVKDKKTRLEDLFNSPFEEFYREEDYIRLNLFVSTENQKGDLHIFVNSRPVFNRNLVEHLRRVVGYKKVGVCFIDIPSYMVDFNVHPKKREVKIYKERKVIQMLSNVFTKPKNTVTLSQEKPYYTTEPVLVGTVDDTLAIIRLGDFLYFFDLHLLSERLNYEMGMDETKSCKLAFKSGGKIQREEILNLVSRWMEFSNPHVCPHGRPIYYKIYLGDIYKNLGRSY